VADGLLDAGGDLGAAARRVGHAGQALAEDEAVVAAAEAVDETGAVARRQRRIF
jgi:hypothetical protein